MEIEQQTLDIVPTALAVRAMRDNGYKNAAYAVAELMDNSIQAGANTVELLCSDKEEVVEARTRRRLNAVAVLDNGSGMDGTILQIALQFGNGSRLEDGKKGGMGRFGMGLPSASISQCRRVDVWSWQDGIESTLHTYVDLDEVEQGGLTEVPSPEARPIPSEWIAAATDDSFGDSGTLVVWSKIDRCLWRTSRALIDNSEKLIGRMYRGWIGDGRVRIRLASFVSGRPEEIVQADDARPNDPMYLMERTSCPKPFDEKPMFVPYPSPETNERKFTVRFRGEDHLVTVRFSIAREEARGPNSGNTAYGRHAGANAGVSVVRAGRELELDSGWTNTYDPRERWWGVEVGFDPGLDDLFGVSNNKQSARNLSEASKVNVKDLAKAHGGSVSALKAALQDDDDPLAPLLDVVQAIQSNIEMMRKQIKAQGEGRGRQRHDVESTEQRATEAVRRRQEEGKQGRSDEEEGLPESERTAELAEEFIRRGREPEEAESLAAETVKSGLKYQMDMAALEAGAFFSVQPRGGVLLVTLNTEHPAYELLLGARNPDELPSGPDELREKLQAAHEGLEMMLFAWARYEDEQSAPEDRRRTQNVRADWGRMAEVFLDSRDED